MADWVNAFCLVVLVQSLSVDAEPYFQYLSRLCFSGLHTIVNYIYVAFNFQMFFFVIHVLTYHFVSLMVLVAKNNRYS